MFFDHDYGKKAENVFRNPYVCFEVTRVPTPDAIDRDQQLQGHDSVIIFGKYEKVTEEADQIRIYGEDSLKRERERGGGFV